jgi:phage tail-like protein
MDANGLRFWQLAQPADWRHDPAETAPLTAFVRGGVRLASAMTAPPATEDPALDAVRRELVPQASDLNGTHARYVSASHQVMASGALADEVVAWTPPTGWEPSDLMMGWDGVLYVASEAAGQIALNDRKRRWDDQMIALTGFVPWRMAAHPDGGAWVLDRQNRRLALLTGAPLRTRPYAPYDPKVWRPVNENGDPPRLELLRDVVWPAGEQPVALAASPGGRLVVLSWVGTGSTIRLLDGKRLADPVRLNLVLHPSTISWVDENLVAVLPAGWKEAAVYDVSVQAAALDPVGDFYPLPDHDGGPFVHGFALPVSYPTAKGPKPLHHISLPSYAPRGVVLSATTLDSFDPHTVWHRLYLEAAIPSHTSIVVWLAARDDTDARQLKDSDWYPHSFGEGGDGPRGAWMREPSEIPFHPGFLECPPKPDEVGLFTALVQRTGRTVRALRGRYLFVKAVLAGDGRVTPELAALRIYGSRFSYRDRYLPELYRESVVEPESEQSGKATRADFLERFLANFEGVLTSIEDRVSFSWLLTDPKTAPDDVLPWLGSFIGFTFDPLVPVDRRRVLLENASQLYRRRGTLQGIELAIDIVTGGLWSSGEVVVFEDWRLRRTFATILGARLDDIDDPLLMTSISSGNSYVGDTFFLGDENRKEFLAIYNADLPETPDEQAAIERLFDQLAYRMTLLVHL